MATAVASHGQVQIPTARLAARVLRIPAHAKLSEHVRIAPDADTPFEAKAAGERIQAEIERMVAETASLQSDNEIGAAVETRMRELFTAAQTEGGPRPEVSARYARLVAALPRAVLARARASGNADYADRLEGQLRKLFGADLDIAGPGRGIVATPGAELEQGEVASRFGAPEQVQALLDLASGQASADEILSSPLMAAVEKHVAETPDTLSRKDANNPAVMEAREFVDPETGEKLNLAQAVARLVELYKEKAGGEVEYDRRSVVVIGHPGAGKSTFIDSLARDLGAAVADADVAKAFVPAYEGGYNTQAVHFESAALRHLAFVQLMEEGVNVIVERVGDDPASIIANLEVLTENGYSAELVHVDVNGDEAVRRMARRFVSSGRYIEPSAYRRMIHKPKPSFDQVIADSRWKGYIEVDANGPQGQHQVTRSGGETAAELAEILGRQSVPALENDRQTAQESNEAAAGGSLREVGQDEKGAFRYDPDKWRAGEFGDALIRLTESADLSTFLHESGHLFHTILESIGTDEAAPAEFKAMWENTLSWWGVTAEQWAALSQEQRVPYFERWARTFEAYLMEGRAPSLSLKEAFATFKAWLSQIYRSVLRLDANLTPEIQNVFDRLLATDEEIAEARAAMGSDFALAREAFKTDEEFAQYQTAIAEARDAQEAELRARAMDAYARKSKRWWRGERERVRDAAERYVDSDPARRAEQWLAFEEWRALAPTETSDEGEIGYVAPAHALEDIPEGLPPMRLAPEAVQADWPDAQLPTALKLRTDPEAVLAEAMSLKAQDKGRGSFRAPRLRKFIKDNGGIQDADGRLREAIGGGRRYPGLINQNGKTPEEMMRLATAAGYFGDGAAREVKGFELPQDRDGNDAGNTIASNALEGEVLPPGREVVSHPRPQPEVTLQMKEELLRRGLPILENAAREQAASIQRSLDMPDIVMDGDGYAIAHRDGRIVSRHATRGEANRSWRALYEANELAARNAAPALPDGGATGPLASVGRRPNTPTVDEALVARAIEHFGLTNDPREAGYVLPDGKLLDLSGRHQMLGGDYVRQGQRNVATGRDWQAGQRQVDHREVYDLLPATYNEDGINSGTARMFDFQTQANAVRLMPGQGISVTVRPTNRQIEAIARMWNKEFRGEPLLIDFDAGQARALAEGRNETPVSVTIERPNVENITRAIDEHFNSQGAEGGATELRQAPNGLNGGQSRHPGFELFQGQQLGSGRSKTVYADEDSADKVVVEMKPDAPTEAFLDFARQAHAEGAPYAQHLPNPTEVEPIDGGLVRYREEKLEPNTTGARVGLDGGDFFLTGLEEAHPQRSSILQAMNALRRHLQRALPDAVRFFFDLGPQNFMQRADGTLVINDPVESGGLRTWFGGAHPGFELFSDKAPNLEEFISALIADLKGERAVYSARDKDATTRNQELEDARAWFEAHEIDLSADKETIRGQIVAALEADRNADKLVDPDTAASWFGFSSGDHLIQALSALKPRAAAVEERIDAMLEEEHGDAGSRGKIEEAARLAAHAEAQARRIELELSALQAATGGRKTPVSNAARAYAQRQVERMTIKQIRGYEQFLAGERRAARNAAEIKNPQEAALWKQRQLISFHLYRFARDAAEEMDRAQAYFQKFDRDTIRAKIHAPLLDQIDQALEGIDLRATPRISAKKRQSFQNWYAEMQAEGLEHMVVADADFMDAVRQKPFASLTLEEARALRDAVKNFEHIGRRWREVLGLRDARLLDEAVAGMTERMAKVKPFEFVNPSDHSPGIIENIDRGRQGAHAHLSRVEPVARAMDGGKDNGPVWNGLFRPLTEARDREETRQDQARRDIEQLFSVYSAEERADMWVKRRFYPQVPNRDGSRMGRNFTKQEILAIALNTGNEYNFGALIAGDNWSETQVRQLLDAAMDQRDWQFVQSLWDYVEGFWPETEALYIRTAGVAPPKVKATPFQNKHGEWRGGYWHLEYDYGRDQRVREEMEHGAVQEAFGGFRMRTQTPNGFAKARQGSGGRPVRLDLSILSEHVNEVIHDLEFRLPVLNAWRLIKHQGFREAYVRAAGQAQYDQLKPWLQYVATERMPPERMFAGVLKTLRRNTPIALMGWAIGTIAQQPAGIMATFHRVGTGRVMGKMLELAGQPWTWMEHARFINARSQFMSKYATISQRELREMVAEANSKAHLDAVRLLAAGNPRQKAQALGYLNQMMQRYAMYPLAFVNKWVASVAWKAAYDKALAGRVEGVSPNNEADVVAYADQMIRTTFGSGRPEDLPAVMRSSELEKMITPAFSYFSTQYNALTNEQMAGAMRGHISPLEFTTFIVWTIVIQALVSQWLAGRWEPDDDESEEERSTRLGMEVAMAPVAGIPLVRDMTRGALRSATTGERFTMSTVPAIGALGSTASGLGMGTHELLTEGEISRASARDLTMAAGYWFGIPSRQLWTTGSYVSDVATGEEEAPWDSEDIAASWREATLRDAR